MIVREELRYRRGTAVGPFIPNHNLLKIPLGRPRKASLPIIAPLRLIDNNLSSSSTTLTTSSTALLDLPLSGIPSSTTTGSASVVTPSSFLLSLPSSSSLATSNSTGNNNYSSYYDRTFGLNCYSSVTDDDSDSSPDTILIESGKRLSAVGLAFGQHLQTMALKLSTNNQDIVNKTRILCARYVRTKLAKKGLLEKHSKQLNRLRSMSNIDFDPLLVDLMEAISDLIDEMDRRSSGLFDSAINRSGSNVSILSTSGRASMALTIIFDEIFRDSISWPKIAAMFGVTGALAVDCASKGKQDYLTSLVDTVGKYTEGKVSRWIHSQGGWSSLIYCYNKGSSWTRPLQYLGLIAAFFTLIVSIIWFRF
ncbi:uncharacterized protein LOC128395912 [Panonychus citri]|uniref:uncharacterized protein LOC128395912 n=1 Tax=Panonychus citri TaxID=50023 RepID=UPI0023078F5D|nr:uncharacterized protein LOC128395912 [Panonychus citri]